MRLALAFSLLLAAVAHAAPPWLAASAPQPGELGARTHAWIVAPSADGSQSILLHVPPRGAGSLGAGDGTVRMARPTGEHFTHAAAYGDEVYLVGEPQTTPGGRTRPVRSARAVAHGAVAGLWVFDPPGRLAAESALPGDGRLAAFAVTETGPAAVLETGGEWSLLTLRDRAWQESSLPKSAPPPGARCALLDAAGELVLAFETEAGVRLWLSDTPASAPEWRAVPGVLESGATDGLMFLGGSLVWTAREGDQSVIWRSDLTIDPPSVSPASVVGVTDEAPANAVAAGMASSGRIAWVWPIEAESAGRFSSLTPPPLEVVELSVFTGRELYRGPARAGGPITVQDFRVLAAALIGATLLVLVLVLRGDADDGVYELPRGCALAEPGRRLAASLIDLFLVAGATSLLTQARVIDLVSLTVLIQPGGAADLGVMIVLGFVVSTLFELTAAGSPGKLALGMRVVRTGAGDPKKLGPASATVRNLVKWALPPLAAMALISPSGRHKGDTIARAVVAVPVLTEDESD